MRISIIILLSFFMIPALAHAQIGQTLVNIPQLTGAGGGFDGYINAVYAMFISIAALLAVVKIIVAGVKYMFTDVVPQKGQAIKDIQGALLGLLVVLAAVLILTVINPNLTQFDLGSISTLPDAPEVAYSPEITNLPDGEAIPLDSPPQVVAAFAEACTQRGNYELISAQDVRCIRKSLSAGDRIAIDNLDNNELDTLIATHVEPHRNAASNEQIADIFGDDVSEVYFAVDETNLTDENRNQLGFICSALVTKGGGQYQGLGNDVQNSSLITTGGGAAGGQITCVR